MERLRLVERPHPTHGALQLRRGDEVVGQLSLTIRIRSGDARNQRIAAAVLEELLHRVGQRMFERQRAELALELRHAADADRTVNGSFGNRANEGGGTHGLDYSPASEA